MQKLLVVSLFLCIVVSLNAEPIKLQDQKRANRDFIKLIEGDIVKPPKVGRAFGLSGTNGNWKDGVVPYEYDYSAGFSSDDKKIIERSMEMITEKTGNCITFRRKTSSDRNWLKFIDDGGCYSYVGKQYYGSQDVSLARRGCMYKGTVVHELLHAIGFYHEQSRPDRDDYIKVHLENVAPSQRHNFDKETGSAFGTKYDIHSIMQYDEYAFSTNGEKTMEARNGERLVHAARFTEDQILSPGDISAIRAKYQCSGEIVTRATTKATTKTTTRSGGSSSSSFSFTFYNDISQSIKLYFKSRYSGRLYYQDDIDTNVYYTMNAYKGAIFVLKGPNSEETVTLGEGILRTSGAFIYASDLF